MLESPTFRGALLSTPAIVRLAVVAALVAGILAVPAVASADTFCVRDPSGCAGPAKGDLKTALASAAANGAAKDTIRLGAGSFNEGPVLDEVGNPVDIVGTSAEDTTLVGTGKNITVLRLLDPGSTVSNLEVKITGTGSETGIELAGKGSHLKVTNSGTQASSKGVAFSGAFPWLQASSVALSYGPNDIGYAVHSAATHATITDSNVAGMRGVWAALGQVDVERSRVWAQQGLTASGAYATASDTSFRVPGPSPSNYTPYALSAAGTGWSTVHAARVSAKGLGTGGVGLYATPTDGAGNHATIDLQGSVIDGFDTAVWANQSGGATSTVTTSWSAYAYAYPSVLVKGGATYTAAASNLDLTGTSVGFLDAANADLRLRHDSPLVDRGDPAFQPVAALDRDGHPRLRDGDGAGGTRVDIGAAEYQRTAPVATATATPATADRGQAVTFTGTASDADAGETPTPQWAFDDGSSASGATAQHAFTSAGAHTATLTITDPTGLTGAAQATVTVNAAAPAPTSAPTPATPPSARPFAGVRLVSTRLSVARRVITLKLTCPAATVGHCSGRTKLTARRRRTSSRAGSPVTLGRATFSIAAGTRARVRVRVSRAGRRRLAGVRRLRGTATNAARSGTGESKTTVAAVTIRRRHH
jgi:PKD domain